MSHTFSYGLLTPVQNLEKTYDPNARKHPHRRADGQVTEWKDKLLEDLFYRALPTTTERE